MEYSCNVTRNEKQGPTKEHIYVGSFVDKVIKPASYVGQSDQIIGFYQEY